MNLEDLVTENLPEDLQSGKTSLQDVWESEYDPLATLRNLNEAEEQFPDGQWQRPLSEASLRIMRRARYLNSESIHLLLQLLQEVSGDESDIPAAIAKIRSSVEEDKILSSADQTLEYLSEEWSDATGEMLATCTGVKPASATRWLGGGKMARSRYNKICVAVLVYRQAILFARPEEVVLWLRSPEADGSSPLEKINIERSSGRWIPWRLRDSLSQLQKGQ